MSCDFTTPLIRSARLLALRPFFAAFLLLEATIFIDGRMQPAKHSPLAYVFAVSIFLFLSAMIFLLVRSTARRLDEFQRKLFMEATLWGIAATLALTTLWGCLEVFAGAPHVPILLNFPIFVTILAIAKVTLFRSNPAGKE